MTTPLARVLACAASAGVLVAGCSLSAPEPDYSTSSDGTQSKTSTTSSETTATETTIPHWPPVLTVQATVAQKLDVPWDVTSVAGATLISTRDSGEILQITADGKTRVVFSSASAIAPATDKPESTPADTGGFSPAGESGLLGITYSAEHGLFAYQTFDNVNRILHFAVEEADGAISLSEPTVVLDGIPAGAIHNGGRLAFGPDGFLYVSTGDTGSLDGSLSQDPASLAGKILRIAADGSIPADNPSPDSAVWSLGHRNVQGLAWSSDGTMFATEFGANTWDELNVIEPGLNYGWPDVEGIAGVTGFQDPVQQWEPSEASPSGMAIADDILYIANLRGESLRAVPSSNPNVSQIVLEGEGRIRAVALNPAGNLWVLTNNTDGRGTPTKKDDRLLELSRD